MHTNNRGRDFFYLAHSCFDTRTVLLRRFVDHIYLQVNVTFKIVATNHYYIIHFFSL